MIDTPRLVERLHLIGLDDWSEALLPLISARLSNDGAGTGRHGDFEEWRDTLSVLADVGEDVPRLREQLLLLSPWRKGPIDVGGIQIDSEWRSDRKWGRVKDSIAPLDDRNVLDVGCGNGYYALQMADEGAKSVIGIDPTILFVMQFLAVNLFRHVENVFVVPARLEELPLPARKFDTTFSMGVLYHQRSPLDHLRHLRQTLRTAGQLVLETIFLPGERAFAATPPDRYARMRNVWLLPTIAELTIWLTRSGYCDVEVIDKSVTTTDEQRSTEWMPFESLREALDANDPTLTVEGWPAPNRVVITAIAR